MTPTCCYAIYEASACRASMGRMLLGRICFVAFRGKTAGFLIGHEDWRFFLKVSMRMKLGFYVGKFSARTCIQIIPDLQFFVLWACFWCHPPPKKTTDKNQVHFVT